MWSKKRKRDSFWTTSERVYECDVIESICDYIDVSDEISMNQTKTFNN